MVLLFSSVFCLYLCYCLMFLFGFFFFKQKTAYEMRISDWSSDVCSSDLRHIHAHLFENAALHHAADAAAAFAGPEPLRLPIPRRVSEACIASVLTLDRFEFQAYAIAQALEPIACRLLFPVQSNHAG